VSAARGGRAGERGVTLVEMLVTVAVMTAGVAAMVGGFAGAERSAAVARSQSALTVALRTASDQLRAAPYLACAGVGQAAGYSITVPGVDAAVTTVTRPEAAPALRSDTGAVTAPATLCAPTGAPAVVSPCSATAGETCDYGLQLVTVRVASAGRTLSRGVWKGAGG
jgi:prepilin-type N-terminal cleavage/methylation domain-containing protein